MLQYLFVIFVTCLISVSASAQTDQQFSIITDEGIITVSSSDSGEDMIVFNNYQWNRISTGTVYGTSDLATGINYNFCLRIASRFSPGCDKGIGFSCGLTALLSYSQVSTDNINRVCIVSLKKLNDYSVCVIFRYKIDWKSLSD